MTTHRAEPKQVYATDIAKLFPLQGEWSEDDYFALPETNRIVELSEGQIIMPPFPGEQHQRGSIYLAAALLLFVDEQDLGIVREAPAPVRLWEGKVREPDVLFIRKEHRDRIKAQYL